MSTEKWIAIESYGRGGDKYTLSVLPEAEYAARAARGNSRQATPAEVAKEKAHRAELATEAVARAAYRARPEHRLADSIRAEIEMDEGEVLDRLTPGEWADIHAKITGAKR